MNPVDAIFALLIFLALWRGYTKGLLRTVAGYVAPVIAFMLAADWSDPVRDLLYAAAPMPDFALDILAPLTVFVVVVASIRLTVAFFASLLGVGQSMPSRVVASLAGGAATALVLGSLVVLVHQLRPERPPILEGDDPEAGEIIVGPVQKLILDLDSRLTGSMLGRPLADFASIIIREAAARKATDAAVSTVGKIPMGSPPKPRNSGTDRGTDRGKAPGTGTNSDTAR